MDIKIEVHVQATNEEVWQAWTTAKDIQAWNQANDEWHCPSASIDLRPEGGFSYRMEAKDGSMGFDFAGIFKEVLPMNRIEFALEDDRRVLVEFIAKDGGVTVRETFTAESENAGEQQRLGWLAILESSKQYLETPN